MLCTRLNDRLLLSEQFFRYIQDENKFNNIKNPDRKEGVSFWQPLANMEIWVGTVGTNYFVFVAIQRAYSFPKTSKDVFNVQEALLTMVHGQVFIIITWNLQRLFPYPPPEDALSGSVGFGTRKVRSIFHIWCTHLYPIISK